jgi:hypothetical protein
MNSSLELPRTQFARRVVLQSAAIVLADTAQRSLFAQATATLTGIVSDMARCSTVQTRQYATPQTELEINKTDGPVGMYWVETTTLVAPGRVGKLPELASERLPSGARKGRRGTLPGLAADLRRRGG